MAVTIVGVASEPPEPFNIRACPVWAIPQLANIIRRFRREGESGAKLIEFRWSDTAGYGVGVVQIIGEGLYSFQIPKVDMNAKHMPHLDWIMGGM